MLPFKITLLGTGTSTGVPVPGCDCPICSSMDTRDKRLRASILVEVLEEDLNNGIEPVKAQIIIDTSTDFRYQALRAKISRIDAVLYTHAHADHIFGIEDLRGFNFKQRRSIPIYANFGAAKHLRETFSYIFYPDPNYRGGALPKLELFEIEAYEKITVAGLSILPISLSHGDLNVLGFRIGPFAYLTDCSFIPEKSALLLRDLELLVIDGLRLTEHDTHFNFAKAIREIERIKPKKALLTHLSHEVTHEQGNEIVKNMTSYPVELAYDGLTFIF